MSILQKDNEVASNRKNKLKDAKAILRDRIVQKLYKQLLEDNVATKLSKTWHTASSMWAEAYQRQKVFLQELDVHVPSDAESDAPTVGSSSNIHLPIPFIVAKTYHARFMQALMGVDPPFSLKARREDGVDRVQVAEDLMRYVINDWANKNRGVEEQVDLWLWNWVTTGTGILKTRWLCEYERFVDVETTLEPAPPVVSIGPDGQEILIPQRKAVEKEVNKELKVFDGPMLEMVQMEDFCMVGGGGDPDLADMVFHRSFMTASQLWSLVDRAIFDEDAVKSVIEGGRDYSNSKLYADIKQQRATDAGKASNESEADADRYEIIESIFKYDVDGSGISSDIVAWFDHDGNLLGATYLRRIIPSGKRPYAVAHFHKRPDQEFGVGLLEVLYPLTKELDAMHNIRIDTGLFTNMPFFFYRPASGMDAETIQLEPGMGYPLQNPQQDIYFPTISNKTSFTAQEEQIIQGYIERLTSISDLSLGVQSGTQGAARTAAGVRALLGESNTNLDVHLKRMNRAWKKALHLLFSLTRDRIKPDFMFRITNSDGQDIFRSVPFGEWLPEVDFELAANSANSNKQVQVETAQTIMTMTMNPINIQLGISGPGEIYEAQKMFLQCIGVKDVSRFLKRPEGHQYVLEPMDEFARIVRGMEVPVALQADHDAFIAFAETMLDKQNEVQTLNEQQITALISQMQKHQQAKAALEQQAAQQAVAAQMQFNASQGAPQVGNPLAGANPGMLPAGAV